MSTGGMDSQLVKNSQPSSSSSNVTPFSSLTEDLLLQVASYVPAKDILNLHCASRELSRLDTDNIWKSLCEKRWEPWPRYRLTSTRLAAMESKEILPNATSWKDRYLAIERDATRKELKLSDLQYSANTRWYLAFVLSGVRGEGRSDFLPITFTTDNFLTVPGHPPLHYQIVDEQPPPPSHIRANIRGNDPFSNSQYLQISDFPPHYISRKTSNGEWLIVNENVIMASSNRT